MSKLWDRQHLKDGNLRKTCWWAKSWIRLLFAWTVSPAVSCAGKRLSCSVFSDRLLTRQLVCVIAQRPRSADPLVHILLGPPQLVTFLVTTVGCCWLFIHFHAETRVHLLLTKISTLQSPAAGKAAITAKAMETCHREQPRGKHILCPRNSE